MEKKQVFISYKSEEFGEALWVKNTLEAQGITCWMAPMCISGGASYAAEIPAAINNCTIFVLILSEMVQQSKWVPRELDQAINANKVIMPFTLEDCQLNDEFGFYLSNIQRYYAYEDKAATMDRMSREIRSILGIPDPPAPEAEVSEPVLPKKEAKKAAPAVKKTGKGKKRLLPVILSVIGVHILSVLLIIIITVGSRVTFAHTAFKKNAYSIDLTGQTVTAQDMQALSKFKNLGRISLKDCTIEAGDLSAFSSHTLWNLELEGCSLTDSQLQSIDFEALEYLNTLKLNNNAELTELKAIAPVADTLTTLSIGRTGITDLEALKDFTKLTELSVENLGLTTLEHLSMSVYLEKLIADGNKLTDLSGLENTTVLKTVSLKDNRLQNAEHLSNSASVLQRLYLDGNELQDLSCLADCTELREFSADRNRLSSIDWAHNWSKLVTLSVSDNQLKDTVVSPPCSQDLAFLDLSGNALTGFSGFSFESDSYVTVNLSDNRFASITLPGNCKYKLFALHGNPLTALSFEENVTGFALSFDYFDGLDSQRVQNLNFNNIYIIDCPPNRIVELEQASKVTLLSRSELPTEIANPEY